MADKKISDLGNVVNLHPSDMLAIVNEGITRKVGLGTFQSFISNGQIISKMYDEVGQLKFDGQLVKGATYFINDRNIWVQALDGDKLSLHGEHLMITPRYEDIGGAIGGMWNSEASYTTGTRVIWDGKVWRRLATGTGNLRPTISPLEWELEQHSPEAETFYYKEEVYFCEYDFDNDWIQLIHDVRRGNMVRVSRLFHVNRPEVFLVLDGAPTGILERFQWGNDSVYSNIVDESLFDCLNNRGQIFGNHVTGHSSVYANTNVGQVAHNTVESGSSIFAENNWGTVTGNTVTSYSILTADNSAGTISGNSFSNKVSVTIMIDGRSSVEGCTFAVDGGNYQLGMLAFEAGKQIEQGFSNFAMELDLDDTNYNSTTQTLTIPASHGHAGIIHLRRQYQPPDALNAIVDATITSIVNLSTNHPVEFVAANGGKMTFVSGTLNGPAANSIILEDAGSLVLQGRSNGSDTLVLRSEDNVNRQIGSSIMTTGPKYLSASGKAGGLVIKGGTAAGDPLWLFSTSHTTKGKIYFGQDSAYDEAAGKLGIGINTPVEALHILDPNPNPVGIAITNGATDYTATDGLRIMIDATGNARIANMENTSLALQTNATNRLSISAAGVVDVTEQLVVAKRSYSGSAAVSASDIDWAAANTFHKTLSANTTVTFSNNINGQTIIVTLANDATGGYTVTWPSGVKWQGGTLPVQTTAASKTDVYTFIQVNGVIYGTVIQNFS